MIEYQNVPGPIGQVVSARLATLVECQTVLSVRDIYNLLEIQLVDAHNNRVWRKYLDKDK